MERRFDARLREMLAQAEVAPELIDGFLGRLETFVASVLGVAGRARTTAAYGRIPHRTCSRSSSTRPAKGSPTCTISSDKVSRSSSGKSRGTMQPLLTTARDAGRRGPGRARRRDRVRSLGLPQEGDQVGGRGPAVVRPTRQGRQLPGRHLHGLCIAKRTCDRQYTSLPSQGMDQRSQHGAKRPESPRGSSSAPATNWRWRCWTNTVRCCPTPGWRATTRWAAP